MFPACLLKNVLDVLGSVFVAEYVWFLYPAIFSFSCFSIFIWKAKVQASCVLLIKLVLSVLANIRMWLLVKMLLIQHQLCFNFRLTTARIISLGLVVVHLPLKSELYSYESISLFLFSE
jgi:hypothetical protein